MSIQVFLGFPKQKCVNQKGCFCPTLSNPTSPLGWGGLGLRLFQSSNWEGLPFPLPPSLGCGSRVSRVVVGSFFGTRFEPPFFHDLGPPKIVITSYFGSKAIPFWGPKRGPKQAPTSELAFSPFFLGFLIFPYHLKCLPYSACLIQTTFSPL